MRRSLKPRITRPHDFDPFWERTVDELRQVDPAVNRSHDVTEIDGELRLESISFSSLGCARIHGYVLHRPGEDRPLVVHGHGYGAGATVREEWARAGLNVVGVDLRGFGDSIDALPNRSHWGYILTGIRSPETSVLRGAVCDYIRAAEVGASLLESTTTRRVLHGASFSGALALMAEAVSPLADLLVVAVPTFGWAEGRLFFVRSGSGAELGRYLDMRPESAEDLMTVLRYFDSMNFADKITCPTLVGIGLSDSVVPAETVYAIANHIRAPHEMMEFPVSHSGRAEEERDWQRFTDRWLQLALKGVPHEYGVPDSRPESAPSSSMFD